jgi:cation transport regulator ChaC
MSASTIAYFGYGSLVNLGSLRTPYISAHRVTLTGWKRAWLARPKVEGSFAIEDGLAFLSVVASPGAQIDGLLITDHASSLASLDEREALYSRVDVDEKDLDHHDEPIVTDDRFLYVADEPAAHSEAKILRSYLDVVMQGYLQQFGKAGLARFMQTTLNFDCPILEDRDEPLYPRATSLSDEEISLFAQLR